MRHPQLVPVTAALMFTLAGCGSAGEDEQDELAPGTQSEETEGVNPAELSVELVDPEGSVVGTATFTDTDGGTQVRVDVSGLTPGFHGMHLHEIGSCEPASPDPGDPARTGDFLSAGPHVGAADATHGRHFGDLSPLPVTERGLGAATSTAGVAKVEDLLDGDGTSLIIHEAPDNLAHVPPRYAPGGPDQETLSHGDSGARIACGAVGN